MYKKNISVLMLGLLFSTVAFSAELTSGTYSCDQGEILILQNEGRGVYRASMTYADGASSSLDIIKFTNGESLIGEMYPDDEGKIGRAVIVRGGFGIQLRFNDGSITHCLKAD